MPPSPPERPEPCPWCQGPSEVVSYGIVGSMSWQVRCKNDEGEGPQGPFSHESEAEAIAAWNRVARRASPVPQDAEGLLEAGTKLEERWYALQNEKLPKRKQDPSVEMTLDRVQEIYEEVKYEQRVALARLVASERAAAVAEERAECLKIADEWVRLEGGFHKLASESRDVQRASDFDEGKAVAEHIAAEIRGRA